MSKFNDASASNDVKGVPLLDQRVDWNWFTNWPDTFAFRGQSYTLQISDASGGDYSIKLKFRPKVGTGLKLVAIYGVGQKPNLALGICGVWNRDGSILEKSVHLNHQTVFAYQFHPTGRLFNFGRNDASANYLSDRFDVRGTV